MSAAPAGGLVPRDPGRQPERTRLSWRRSVLTVTVVAMLGTRLAVQLPTGTLRLLTVAAVLAGWLAVLLTSWRRIAAMAAREPVPVRWAVPLTTLAALGLAGLGLVLVTTV